LSPSFGLDYSKIKLKRYDVDIQADFQYIGYRASIR
jgi:hypothetical protein